MANGLVSVKADVREVERLLTGLERKQLPFAIAKSLTLSAKHVQRKTIPRVMTQVFDRPTSFAKRGFYVIPATKQKQTAIIQIKDGVTRQPGRGGKIGTPAFNFLRPQIYGGNRNAKRHEIALRRMGVLGTDEYTVPGRDMRLNQFGNLTGNMYSKILADVNNLYLSGGDDISHGFGQRTTKRGKRRFFYHPNLRPRGIYMRQGRKIIVALLFIKSPRYRKRFDFHDISRRAAAKRFRIEFPKALKQAIATAR